MILQNFKKVHYRLQNKKDNCEGGGNDGVSAMDTVHATLNNPPKRGCEGLYQ